MTGFASLRGEFGPHSWAWELRSVNAKGLDLRLRVPDWIEGLEQKLRPILGATIKRGSVTLSLRITREEGGGELNLNTTALERVLSMAQEAEATAHRNGLTLAPMTAADLLSIRGVVEQGGSDDDTGPLAAELLAQLSTLLGAFNDMRGREGEALDTVLRAQIAEIARLTDQAATLAEARKSDMAASLAANLAKVLDTADGADPDRVAQELAMLAVKSDVTEELDRLRAHIAAALDLLDADGPVGRKLDFLMQEFNREANTLCSKSQSTALTQVGLDLKAVIDQMREQVQNVE
ncbi:YicC/YloC family endoribonuclease [Thalassococcus sp. S3]|uniref:YicC/YloC family endoribonuclease n=1 Tax=Thalassococcus sp. S3 TaxID=2017482 RepID=UPI0020C2235F|nr:YicC/YloC family endoribonuclease [Thalassococcus sp. S3]